MAPVPEMLLAMVVSADKSNLRVPLLVTSPEPIEPVVEPLPTCRVPAEMVVAPEYVLFPVKINAPAPALVKVELVPEITPL